MLTLTAEVKVYAPSFEVESWKVWRKGRSDEKLKTEYRIFLWDRYRINVPLREIRVGERTAA